MGAKVTDVVNTPNADGGGAVYAGLCMLGSPTALALLTPLAARLRLGQAAHSTMAKATCKRVCAKLSHV